MEFPNIQYIFQIPLDWLRAIHNRCFHSYGGNLIDVHEGQYGGYEIGVNDNEIRQFLDNYLGDVASFTTAPSAANQVVMTDATPGKLKTLTPYATSPYTVDVITGATWTGTQITFTAVTLTFTNGILTNSVTKEVTPISTVTYSP